MSVNPGGERPSLPRHLAVGVPTSFLISLTAMPIAYLAQVALARSSQEAVGTFAAIVLTVAFVSSFFYFGGSSVIIKYLPEILVHRRPAFLLSFGAVVACVTAIGLLVVVLWSTTSGLPGQDLAGRFGLLLVPLAVISLLQDLSLAGLRAEMKLVQAYVFARIPTLGYCLVFGGLLICSPTWFRLHAGLVVVVVYLALTLVSFSLALLCLARQLMSETTFSLAWYLPQGFWRFAGVVQVSSVVGFLQGRVDQVLVLFYSGVVGLGLYFVLVNLAMLIHMISGHLLEAVFPVLVNAAARRGMDGLRDVYYYAARVNQLIVTSVALALLCLHASVLSAFGPQYLENRLVLILLVLFAGITSVGSLNAYALVGNGKPHKVLVCQLVQLVVFCTLFYAFDARNSLLALSAAQGMAAIIGLAGTILAVRRPGFDLRLTREFWASLVVLLGVAGVCALAAPLTLAPGVALLGGAGVLFAVLGGYRWSEVLTLAETVRQVSRPTSRAADSSPLSLGTGR